MIKPTIVWERLCGMLGVNLDTGESFVCTMAQCEWPFQKAIFYNGRRSLVGHHFYLVSSEEEIGPFLFFEEVLAEREYRLDPLAIDYNPARDWKIAVR